MTKRIVTMRNMITGGALVLTSALGTAGVASAATAHPASTTHLHIRSATNFHDLSGDQATTPPVDGVHTLLTGSTLSSAEAAANAAVPGATVLRAEGGPNSTYEVHMKKANGTLVRVVENSSFTVTSEKQDFSPGHLGRPGAPGDLATPTHGPGETALTGSTLSSAGTAANAAVPGATVLRAETDAHGATYEVHLKKADGTYETVKENASFVVTSMSSGVATPPAGAPGAPGSRDQRPGESLK